MYRRKSYHASAAPQRFREELPHKPYCTNDFTYGVRVLPKNTAILARSIQQSQPHALYWFPFDADRVGVPIGWSDRDRLTLNITVESPRDGHVHLLYAFALSARTAPGTSASTLRYTAVIERMLCEKLGADMSYNGLICRNPCHPEWQGVERRKEPYILDELASYLDLSASTRRSANKNYGLGRSYHLFEKAHKWAYRAIRQDWPTFSQWPDTVTQHAEMHDASFLIPLSPAECRAIGKNIAKCIHRKFSPEGFSAVQATRGHKDGTKSKHAAVPTSAHSLKPWEALGISRTMYYRKLECDPDLTK